MKNKYTRKQIVEAISYWKKQLKFLNEDGMSIDEILAMDVGKKWRDDAAAEEKRKKEMYSRQLYKEIWVKDIKRKNDKSGKTVAELQITSMDGRVEQVEREVTCNIRGDKYFKQIAKQVRDSKRAAGSKRPVEDIDIQLAMLHIFYNDTRIQWYYGPDKVSNQNWFLADEVDEYAEERENGYGSEAFMEAFLDAKMGGSSDPWADAEIACGIRDVSDFRDYNDDDNYYGY